MKGERGGMGKKRVCSEGKNKREKGGSFSGECGGRLTVRDPGPDSSELLAQG